MTTTQFLALIVARSWTIATEDEMDRSSAVIVACDELFAELSRAEFFRHHDALGGPEGIMYLLALES